MKLVRGKSRRCQRGQRRRRARRRLHPDSLRDGLAHQPVAGIGDQRRARVRDQRHARTRFQFLDQLRCAHGLVVLVITDRRFVDAVVIEQLARLPRVLASHQVCLAQNPQRAQRDVLQIADRRGHQVERSGHGYQSMSRTAACTRNRPAPPAPWSGPRRPPHPMAGAA